MLKDRHPMRPTCSLTPLAMLIAASLLPANAVRAQQSADAPRDLDAVTVQGTVLGDASAGSVRNYAGSRQLIDERQLSSNGYRGLDDALQHVPGVKIFDETGTGVLPQIMLRGLYESRSGRVQVLEDGIPLALAPYGQSSLSLFPVTMNQIGRVDIVRGGAAVQYGPNNVGGVINLISKPIPQEWTTTLGTRLTTGGAHHALWDTAVSTGGYLDPDVGVQLDVDRLAGHYGRDHSRTEVGNARVRTEWWLADDRLLKADLGRYVANTDLAGALSVDDYLADPRRATRPLDHFSGRTTRGSLTYQQDLGNWGPFGRASMVSTAFSAHSARDFTVGLRRAADETWRPDLPAQLRQRAPRDFAVYGAEQRLSLHTDGPRVSHGLTAGLRLVREDIGYLVARRGLDDGVASTVRDWAFRDHAVAAYLSDAIGLLGGRLTITPGLRYEHLDSSYRDRARKVTTRNGIRNLLPGLTVGYAVAPGWYLYADAQRSLRAPQVTQIVFGDNLDSELAWNYEAGVRRFVGEALSLDVGAYRIDFDSQIALDNTTRSYRNLGRTRHQGVEASFAWHPAAFDPLQLQLGYAYLDATQRSGPFAGMRVPYTSRQQYTFGASVEFGRTQWALNGYYFSRAFTDAANTPVENAIASVGPLPSYAVWNVQVTHTFAARGGTALKGTFAVNNLFDRRYYFRGIDTSPWGRQPAPARAISAGLELAF